MDLGWNWDMKEDVRFIISKLANSSTLQEVKYGNETFFLKNTQRQFRAYDKIKQMEDLAHANKQTITKSDVHNILREELALFKTRNIQNAGFTIKNVFEFDTQKAYFLYWKKKLGLPARYKVSFNLKTYFETNGIQKTMQYLGKQGIAETGLKTFVQLFKVLDVPRKTAYRYKKQLSEILSTL